MLKIRGHRWNLSSHDLQLFLILRIRPFVWALVFLLVSFYWTLFILRVRALEIKLDFPLHLLSLLSSKNRLLLLLKLGKLSLPVLISSLLGVHARVDTRVKVAEVDWIVPKWHHPRKTPMVANHHLALLFRHVLKLPHHFISLMNRVNITYFDWLRVLKQVIGRGLWWLLIEVHLRSVAVDPRTLRLSWIEF